MSNTSGATDLFSNDTTATGRAPEGAEVDRDAIDTDAVAAATAESGPGTQADAASSTNAASGAVRASGAPAAVPLQPGGSSGSGPAIDAAAPATDEPIPGSQESGAGREGSVAGPRESVTATPDAAADTAASVDAAAESEPPVDDYSIAHVFDQTNGVIEHVDGDEATSTESGDPDTTSRA